MITTYNKSNDNININNSKNNVCIIHLLINFMSYLFDKP